MSVILSEDGVHRSPSESKDLVVGNRESHTLLRPSLSMKVAALEKNSRITQPLQKSL